MELESASSAYIYIYMYVCMYDYGARERELCIGAARAAGAARRGVHGARGRGVARGVARAACGTLTGLGLLLAYRGQLGAQVLRFAFELFHVAAIGRRGDKRGAGE